MKKITFLLTVIIVFLNLPLNYVEATETDNIIDKVNQYSESDFIDIGEEDWFYKYVATAYEYGVVSGNGNGIFNPDGNITIAESLTIASRLNQKTVNKNREFPKVNSDVWYAPYVSYAESTGIIPKGKFLTKYDNAITRAEFVYIMCNCLRDKELKNENPYTKNIPDMTKNDNYYDYVLKAIKSGIVTGKDEAGNFYPNDYITRAEVSTILTRIIERNERKSKVREITKDWTIDREEYYRENNKIRNYGDFNKIYNIFRGYNIRTEEAIYMYIYDGVNFESYVKFLKEEGYNVTKTHDVTGVYTEYTCLKGSKPSLIVQIFP